MIMIVTYRHLPCKRGQLAHLVRMMYVCGSRKHRYSGKVVKVSWQMLGKTRARSLIVVETGMHHEDEDENEIAVVLINNIKVNKR